MIGRILNSLPRRGPLHPAFVTAAVALLAAGAVLAAALHAAYLQEIQAGHDRAATLAQLLEEETLRTFQGVDLVLQSMVETSRSPELAEHDPKFRESLKRRLEYLPRVRALFVIGPDGFITHDTDYPSTQRISLADRAYFQFHRNDASSELRVGRPLRSRSVGTWFVSVTRRIDAPDGSFAGVAVAALETAYYDSFYSKLNLGPTDAVVLIRTDTTLIARAPESIGRIGEKLPGLQVFQELPNSSRGTFVLPSSPFDGRKRIVSYRAVRSYPLVTAVALGWDALLGSWTYIAWVAFLGFAALALLLLSATLFLVERHYERQEAQKRALTIEKLHTIGRMAGGIAHDFNNVINAVSVGLQLVDRNVDDPAKVRAYTAMVREAVDRGAALAGRMLNFARGQQVELSTASVNDLLERLKPMLQQAAGPAVQITLRLAGDLTQCRLDPAQFDAALLNLVINARDAMPGGGTIEISTSVWTEPARSLTLRPGSYVRVRVRDNGPGLPRPVLDRVFEPFFTTKGEGGTGLGLPQVLAVMRQIGGDARLTSKPGVGTTVDLLFPCDPAAAGNQHPAGRPTG